jgi:hypothetical protein
MIARALSLLFCTAFCCLADLEMVKAEPNLEKRSEKALKNAHAALDKARQNLKDGDRVSELQALTEVGESVELAKKSLDDSGKNPRRSPKYFKRAEIELRKLIRRLDNFRIEQSVDDREPTDKLLEMCHRIHEDLILGIMGRKGK